jgi:hypothetical protein
VPFSKDSSGIRSDGLENRQWHITAPFPADEIFVMLGRVFPSPRSHGEKVARRAG